MASGTITGKMTGDYGLQIRWTSTPDIATNTSAFTMQVYVLYPSINISSRSGCYTTINGSKVEFKTGAIKNEYKGATLLTTRTVTIQHDEDGKKSIPVIAYFPIYLKSESLGWIYEMKASGTCVLDDIPRASRISSQTQSVTVNGESKWSIVVNRHVDTFYHKATLSIGGYIHTTEAFATNGEYIIPTEWLNAIPDATKGTVNVSVQTYSDSTCETAIGDAVETSFEIVVPATAAPLIEAGWASIAPYNTGTAADGMNVYVQGYSKAEVTFDDSKASARYGAEIASVQVSWDGAETTAAPYRTKLLNKAGSQTVTCTVIDTRGLTATQEIAIEVQAYSAPNLSGISVYRCDSTGSADDAGAYIWFKADCTYADCAGENTLSMKAAYRPASNSMWAHEEDLESGIHKIIGGGSISSTLSYVARIRAVDRLGNIAEFTALIGTAEVAFNIMPGGKGAAFGKYAEKENTLDMGDWSLIAANLYPVGSVYMDYENDPSELYGGTWEQVTGTGLPFNIWKRTK